MNYSKETKPYLMAVTVRRANSLPLITWSVEYVPPNTNTVTFALSAFGYVHNIGID